MKPGRGGGTREKLERKWPLLFALLLFWIEHVYKIDRYTYIYIYIYIHVHQRRQWAKHFATSVLTDHFCFEAAEVDLWKKCGGNSPIVRFDTLPTSSFVYVCFTCVIVVEGDEHRPR